MKRLAAESVGQPTKRGHEGLLTFNPATEKIRGWFSGAFLAVAWIAADGKVFVGTQNSLLEYGLLN